jgi:hypothetical protein
MQIEGWMSLTATLPAAAIIMIMPCIQTTVERRSSICNSNSAQNRNNKDQEKLNINCGVAHCEGDSTAV